MICFREDRACSRAAHRPRMQPRCPEDGGTLECRRWGRAGSRAAGDSDNTKFKGERVLWGRAGNRAAHTEEPEFKRGRVLWGRACNRAAHTEEPEVRRDCRACSRAAGDITARQSW